MAWIDAGNGHVLATNFHEDTDPAHIFASHGTGSIGAFGEGGDQAYRISDRAHWGDFIFATGLATIRGSIGLIPDTLPPNPSSIIAFYDGGTRQAFLRLLSSGQVSANGATGTFLLPPGVRSTIEFEVVIHNTAGSWIVRLNGDEVINETGLNTRAGTGTNQATSVRISDDANELPGTRIYTHAMFWTPSGAAPTGWFGDLKPLWRQADGAGSSAQFAVTGAAANWQAGNEAPPSDSQYIESATVGNKDFYTMADLPFSVGQVYGVIRVSRARKTDAGTGSIRQNVRHGGVDGNGGTIALGTSDDYYRSAFMVNPSTSAAWTIAEVNAMEFGSEVTA